MTKFLVFSCTVFIILYTNYTVIVKFDYRGNIIKQKRLYIILRLKLIS